MSVILKKKIIRGNANLKPFKEIYELIPADDINKNDEIWDYSNPKLAQKKANEYLGDVIIYRSNKKDKKFMVFDPYEEKMIHFGQMGYEDYLKHKDYDRMLRYRARATNMKGDWRNNPYSANNLSINILW